MEPQFKIGDRVWSRTYDCFGTVRDADIVNVLTEPHVDYHIQLDDYRGNYITGDSFLEKAEPHETIRN